MPISTTVNYTSIQQFWKIALLLILVLNASFLFGQTLRNPGFDSVYIGGIDRIYDWIPSSASPFYSIQDTVLSHAPDTCYDWVDPMLLYNVQLIYNQTHSGYGIKLTTSSLVKENGDPFETFIVNGGTSYKTGSDGYIAFEKMGEPFAHRPTSMLGWYQFVDSIPQTVDYGKCRVLLKKYNPVTNQSEVVGIGEELLEVASSWTAFQVPITYQSTAIPDSIVVLFIASTNPNEYAELWLDELSFDFSTNSEEIPDNSIDYPGIYPNPNTGFINIEGADHYTSYQLISLDGRILKTGDCAPQISVENIPQRIFILQLFDKNQFVKAFRIIKQ